MTGPGIDQMTALLEGRLRAHDRDGAVSSILSAVESGLAIEDLYSQVLEPFLVSVGLGWQQGDIAVWEEHLIVGAVRTAVEALYPAVIERKRRTERVPVKVAFFCPLDEVHDLALRMLADRFDLRGFTTVYVGAMTPVEQMIECARSEAVDVVCLSASSHFQRVALRDVVARLREGLPGVRLVVGGPAFARSEEGWEDLTVESVDALMDELTAKAGGSADA